MNGHAALNRFYRLVWSDRLAAYVVAAENVKGRGQRAVRAGALLAALFAVPPAPTFAAPPAPPTPTPTSTPTPEPAPTPAPQPAPAPAPIPAPSPEPLPAPAPAPQPAPAPAAARTPLSAPEPAAAAAPAEKAAAAAKSDSASDVPAGGAASSGVSVSLVRQPTLENTGFVAVSVPKGTSTEGIGFSVPLSTEVANAVNAGPAVPNAMPGRNPPVIESALKA